MVEPDTPMSHMHPTSPVVQLYRQQQQQKHTGTVSATQQSPPPPPPPPPPVHIPPPPPLSPTNSASNVDGVKLITPAVAYSLANKSKHSPSPTTPTSQQWGSVTSSNSNKTGGHSSSSVTTSPPHSPHPPPPPNQQQYLTHVNRANNVLASGAMAGQDLPLLGLVGGKLTNSNPSSRDPSPQRYSSDHGTTPLPPYHVHHHVQHKQSVSPKFNKPPSQQQYGGSTNASPTLSSDSSLLHLMQPSSLSSTPIVPNFVSASPQPPAEQPHTHHAPTPTHLPPLHPGQT
eukprot:TRINITY_DN12449_c0_g1_i1.p1 TRINITY_DN12449_c0_g1~~TRINITY_DN12449_c0_g1_i1.p1  ORF type:complete len:286 (-),score=48.59 TRINITY_DN12449_c0_g1_i1:50-907(-)